MHLRRSTFATVLAGALLLAVAATARPLTSPKGYQITPAPGWSARTGAVAGSDLAIIAPRASNFSANINIVVGALSPGETLATDAPHLKAMYSHAFKGYQQLSQSYVTIDGQRTILLVARYQAGTPARTVRAHEILAFVHGKSYAFACTSLESNHAKYDPAFESMIISIRWTK